MNTIWRHESSLFKKNPTRPAVQRLPIPIGNRGQLPFLNDWTFSNRPLLIFSWHSFRYDRWRLILEWGQMTLIIRFLLEGFHDAAAFFNGSVLPAWSSCSSPRGKHMQKSLAAYCRQIHREACLHNAAYAVIRKRNPYIIACAGNTAKPAAEAWKALLHKTTRRQPDSGQ